MSTLEEQQAYLSFDQLAIGYVKEYIATHKGPFRAENVRIFAKNNGLETTPWAKSERVRASNRIWGSVMQRAKKQGLIVEDGYAAVKNPKAHGAIVRQWRAA